MKNIFFVLLTLAVAFQSKAQPANCVFKEPQININFGAGYAPDLNTEDLYNYRRVSRYCPTDGHYTYTPFTSDCFRGDWQSLSEDHTAGDVDGNMMLVNASPGVGAFLVTTIIGLKSNTMYEFGAWMMNVCRPTEKCPFPLLPDILIRLETRDGKMVAQFNTGELSRLESPQWKQYRAMFTAPATESALILTMIDNAPGGCGNDFALDDITFRECVPVKPVVKVTPKAPVLVKKQPPPPKPVVKKQPPPPPPVVVSKPPAPKPQPPAPKPEPPAPKPEPVKQPVIAKAVPIKQPPPPVPVVAKEPPAPKPVAKQPLPPPVVVTKPPAPKPVPKKQPPVVAKTQPPVPTAKPPVNAPPDTIAVAKSSTVRAASPPVFAPPPPVLRTRANQLIRQIEMESGQITFNLYDNGTIDDDTVSIYHNNVLLMAHARLSQKPITFHITLDPEHPHHELIMVAENLGSIPPNTSLMVVTVGSKRYEVYISSTEQKNAKVIFDLKE